jgi:hypothetical protein
MILTIFHYTCMCTKSYTKREFYFIRNMRTLLLSLLLPPVFQFSLFHNIFLFHNFLLFCLRRVASVCVCLCGGAREEKACYLSICVSFHKFFMRDAYFPQ